MPMRGAFDQCASGRLDEGESNAPRKRATFPKTSETRLLL